jgi:hypothetical protein
MKVARTVPNVPEDEVVARLQDACGEGFEGRRNSPTQRRTF